MFCIYPVCSYVYPIQYHQSVTPCFLEFVHVLVRTVGEEVFCNHQICLQGYIVLRLVEITPIWDMVLLLLCVSLNTLLHDLLSGFHFCMLWYFPIYYWPLSLFLIFDITNQYFIIALPQDYRKCINSTVFFTFDTHCFGNGPDNKVLRMARWKAHLSPWISVYCNSVIQKSLLTYMVWRLYHFKKKETNQTTVMKLNHFWMYIMILYFNEI